MKERRWNQRPTVKSVFYDDFSEGLRGDVWRALHEKWASQNNNGYAEDNCLYSTCYEVVEDAGAMGGIVVIRSNGDFAPVGKQRQGGGIVTKKLFGPGLYEVRMKVVPRVGQCSAAWTYFNDWASTYEARKYSEIDIEMPHGGDYRKFSGTTYENYLNGEQKNSASEVVDCNPLNDGAWHVFAFEWRNDEEHGDTGIQWYLDGEPVLFLGESVPRYTATFWVASLFQDAIAWLGDPQFEAAYLYLDWVRITEYNDPCLPGSAEKESKLNYIGIDLGDAPLPKTEYLANANFSAPPRVKNFKGREIVSWELCGEARLENALLLGPAATAMQLVTAQYGGFSFKLEVETERGYVEAFLEYCKGKANCEVPELTAIGVSEERLSLSGRAQEGAVFRVPDGTEHLRVVLTAGKEGATVKRCSLTLI